MPKLFIGILLVGMALTKAIIVAMFFMHLKFEKKTLALIAATPLILCALLMFALLPDHDPKLHPSTPPPAASEAPAHS
jgi:caa(3)-type oxidase subunit IV